MSECYPNPFNPATRLVFHLPVSGGIKLDIYNTLGQRIVSGIEKQSDAGNNYIDIELKGLPNGIYFARVNLNDKYFITRKLVLMYGSKHLQASSSIPSFSKSAVISVQSKKIDSLVASSAIIGKKVFPDLPAIISSTTDLGNLVIERYCTGLPTVTYEGKVYNTVQIGTQCWLRENLDAGTMILSSQEQTDNSVIEKYCYKDDEANCAIYCALYKWDEAMGYSNIPGTKGICPPGFHIPTEDEFRVLATLVNYDCTLLLAVGQGGYDVHGTNISGFTALLAGMYNSQGFYAQREGTTFWGSFEVSSTHTNMLQFDIYNNYVLLYYYRKSAAFSVRCLKDN